MKPLLIDQLRYDAVEMNSTHFNFGAGWGDTWEVVYPTLLECDYCQHTFSDTEHDEGDTCPEKCNDNGELRRPECAPMMNYFYPLPNYGHYGHDNDPEGDQKRLCESSVNVVIVKIMGGEDDEDTYALALSGGGMDLSWDICHAFILLGYAPPLAFCDVPEFAGQDNRREPFWSILKACLQSTQSAKQVAESAQSRLATKIDNALACPDCGHPDWHNRFGCEYNQGMVRSCYCRRTPEGRPSDAKIVRELAAS